MIIGFGSDLVNIPRIEKALARHGERFEKRLFTEEERRKAEKRGKISPRAKAATLATRFAAKEAFCKALGTGFAQGISWHDIEVTNLSNGKPELTVIGKAASFLRALTPFGMMARIDLSLSDDYPMAQASIIISAVSLSAKQEKVELPPEPRLLGKKEVQEKPDTQW